MSSPGASSSSSSGAGKNLPTPTAEVLESLPTHMLIQELTRRHRILGAPLKKAVIMGPPGSGKSSIADHFRYNFGYCSVLPNEADSQLSAGEKMQRIQERLSQPQCRRGFVVDGFPENTVQAEILAKAPNALPEQCLILDADSVSQLHNKINGELPKNFKFTDKDLAAYREDMARVASWFEQHNVRCEKINVGGLGKDEMLRKASEKLFGGEGVGAAATFGGA